MIEPEQSTDAIMVHKPEAKCLNIKIKRSKMPGRKEIFS